ncbi:5-oxoprolinase subunit B family protein [Streptomyces sp. BI20]|uniref:5-oxoprolinase subunit B family protein n=1 Tax=Streptomyces sp. BI20 TaxID=3403460 RepID=UPI003C744DDC
MRVLPYGPDALLVETDSGERCAALHAELVRRLPVGAVRDVVPAARTVLLDGFADPGFRARLAAELPGWEVPKHVPAAGAEVVVPVRFDGPDLAEVARLWGVAPGRVAEIVGGTPFRVAFCGFAPGFGYLTGLPEALWPARRASPRPSVPAGSLGLAGEYAGIYPRSSPGGWRLIGTAEVAVWDPGREPAALFAPGDTVRFTAVER